MQKYLFILVIVLSLFIGDKNVYGMSCWNQKTDFGGDARHRGIGFSIGGRGYMGLGHINSIVDILYDDIWEYDPGTNSWMQKANFGGGQRMHAVAFGIGSKGYVGTGRMPSGLYANDLWQYDPTTNVWTAMASMPALERRGAVAFVANGEGYVGTGLTTSGYSVDFMKYNPALNAWLPVAPFIGFARTAAAAFALNNKGYVGTGGANDFYQYDPLTDSWAIKAVVGPTSRQEANGFAVGGKGYIGTGDDFSSGTNFGDFWQYNDTTDTWVQIEDFGGIARRYLASFTIGLKAYAGTGTSGTNYKDFWEFDPALIGVSVAEQNKSQWQISVYPNPVSEYLTVQTNAIDLTNGYQLNLVNCSGQIVYMQKMNSNAVTIDCNAFEQGNYILQFFDKTKKMVSSQKVIIQK